MTGISFSEGDDIQIKGATDATLIGNVSDRLKVDASISVSSTLPAWTSALRYDDMSLVARETSIPTSATWTTIYSYTGSGYLAGFLVTVETFAGWEFRLLVDSATIFSFIDTELTSDNVYDVDDPTDAVTSSLGIGKGAHDKFTWSAPLDIPMRYATSVQVQIRRPTAAAKKFKAGLAVLSKLT